MDAHYSTRLGILLSIMPPIMRPWWWHSRECSHCVMLPLMRTIIILCVLLMLSIFALDRQYSPHLTELLMMTVMIYLMMPLFLLILYHELVQWSKPFEDQVSIETPLIQLSNMATRMGGSQKGSHLRLPKSNPCSSCTMSVQGGIPFITYWPDSWQCVL